MSKVRIYDLARSKVPEDLDDKTKKKIQAELTRQILTIAPEFGEQPKTASSSIAQSNVEGIFSKIDLESVIGDFSSGLAKAKTTVRPTVTQEQEVTNSVDAGNSLSRSGPVQEGSAEDKPKKKLKIVRRITRTEQEETEAANLEGESSQASEVTSTEQDKAQTPSEESSKTETRDDDNQKQGTISQENLDDIFGSKKPNYSRDSVQQIKDMSNVRSIPLRPTPVSSQPQVPSQPYRVARPTSSSQGIGRKKKRSSGSSDDRPKVTRKPRIIVEDQGPKEITITKPMTVRELSQSINLPETQIITFFFMKKIVKTVNDMLEKDLIIEFLQSLNYTVHTESKEEEHEELKTALAQDESEGNLEQRPPVVTIMGHVDHGKTTLVDTIRKVKAKVVDTESGGITQHISTYRIEAEDFDGNTRKVTILDTPGHEAFTAMRKRGASVTDIIVLIVAADDGVMPQTIECINHIKESKIPFLVAVNKIDKPGANPDKVLGQLSEYGIITENYGGKVECAFVSALNGDNIDDLLMKVILVADAELADKIQSNPNRLAIGTVIEAELSRTKGPLATVLVQNGTMHIGDFVAAGGVHGRVKSMIDENGQSTDAAVPSSAVQVLGLSGVPKAGDTFRSYESLKEAKKSAEEVAQEELEAKRFRGISTFASEIREGQEKELRIMIKADVQGSAEAISHELNKLSTEEVLVKPISIESGSITANDVQMAEQTGAVVVGFHVGADTAATAKLAEKLGVKIKSYEIIYKLTEDLERAVLGLHEPEIEEQKLGEIEVRKIFEISNRKIAGCYVTNGKVVRNEIARVVRDGVKIYEGKVDYLRRFKDDAKEVKENFECGLSFEKYNDLQENDIIECWTVKEIARASL